jgi:hypothetical protein
LLFIHTYIPSDDYDYREWFDEVQDEVWDGINDNAEEEWKGFSSHPQAQSGRHAATASVSTPPGLVSLSQAATPLFVAGSLWPDEKQYQHRGGLNFLDLTSVYYTSNRPVNR